MPLVVLVQSINALIRKKETYSATMGKPLENEMGLGSHPMKCFKNKKELFFVSYVSWERKLF